MTIGDYALLGTCRDQVGTWQDQEYFVSPITGISYITGCFGAPVGAPEDSILLLLEDECEA